MGLRALVLGSGYAGQGHAMALRDAGVEIAAMASRTEDVVRRVAAELEIPLAFTDWREALERVKPDIVAVGTPGGAHREMISAALEAGCHVYADKPLATTAPDARELYRQAVRAGVKAAYAASFRYQPQALLARKLVREGAIGPVQEVECVSHYNWPRLAPFGWSHRVEEGGGRLNNNFTHKLAIVLHVLGGEVLAAMGEARNDLKRAPVGPRLHDFREFTRSALTPEEAEKAQWREVTSDWSYTALVRIGDPERPGEAANAAFRHSCLRPAMVPDYIVFYGEDGTVHVEGAYATGGVFLCPTAGEWQEIPIPQEIHASLPAIEDNTQRNWTQLARELVADIRGEGDADYLTFRDGWLFQEVIDIIRAGNGWTPVPRHA